MLILKRKLYGFVGKRLMKRHGEMVPDTPSPFEVPSRWVEPHKRARIYYGKYEKNESALVARYLDPKINTIELGSGIGVVSSHVCRRLDPGTRFYGVEGNPEIAEVAQRNIDRFETSVERKIVHAVVAGKYVEGGTRTFNITPGNFHLSSIGTTERESIEVVVPEISLSELLRRHDYDEYQLVSDVEGAELEIFQEDPQALDKCKQMIIELHHCENKAGEKVSIDDLRKLAVGLGFKEVAHQSDAFAFQR